MSKQKHSANEAIPKPNSKKHTRDITRKNLPSVKLTGRKAEVLAKILEASHRVTHRRNRVIDALFAFSETELGREALNVNEGDRYERVQSAIQTKLETLTDEQLEDQSLVFAVVSQILPSYGIDGKSASNPRTEAMVKKDVSDTTPTRPTGADYVRRSRENRIAQGGEYFGGALRPEAGAALRALVAANAYPSKAAAVEGALINEEKRLRRKLRRKPPNDPS